jgi:hypothetical protein
MSQQPLPCSYLTMLLRFFESFMFRFAESLDFDLATSLSKVTSEARFAGLIFGCYHRGLCHGVTRLPLADEDSDIPSSYRVNQ